MKKAIYILKFTDILPAKMLAPFSQSDQCNYYSFNQNYNITLERDWLSAA